MKHFSGTPRAIAWHGARSLFLSLTLGVGVLAAGCVGDPASIGDVEQVGSLDFNLKVAPGVTLTSVAYTISKGDFEKSGAIDVENAPFISATIGGIPEGKGYKIALLATSKEDGTVFQGSTTFDVIAGQTTAVTLSLRTATNNGSVAISATLNAGPVIEELTVTPLVALLGGEITLRAVAEDPDQGPSSLSYSWSVSDGTLEDSTAAVTKLAGSRPGNVVVTLSVSDGDIVSTKATVVTFVDSEGSGGSGGRAGSGGALGSGGATESGGATSAGGALAIGGTTASGGASNSGGESASGGTDHSGGATGSGGAGAAGGATDSGGATGVGGANASGGAVGVGAATGAGGAASEQPGSLTLVTTAVAANAAGRATIVIDVPSGVQTGDTAVVFLLVTGSGPPIAGSPQGFVTTQLAAAQHILSYGPVGEQRSLTWTSTASATIGATALFFRGPSIAVEALSTSQPSGTAFGLPASTQAPRAEFASGYALFGIQLPLNNTLTIASGPEPAWLGPITDGRQLYTWVQPYVQSPSGFSFPASSGVLSDSGGIKRQAQVFVSSPAR